ncbi:MAG: efflux RND transporter permease subunit, partial [Myxococcota bacterium]
LCALFLGVFALPALAALLFRHREPHSDVVRWGGVVLGAAALVWVWRPLGEHSALPVNGLFVVGLVVVTLAAFSGFQAVYPSLLRSVLRWRRATLVVAAGVVAAGVATLPTFGREQIPAFDEGAFLYMPTTMPHASIGQALEMLANIDAAIASIPEVERVVGKIGRVDSALDPAPISMLETVVKYVPEYGLDESGDRRRLWREEIRSPDDIWKAVVDVAQWPGVTSAPKLMPIQARLVMLRSGMRAPLGLKVRGPDLGVLERFGVELESVLKQVPQLRPETVFADRVVGKPYVEVSIDRQAASRFGLSVAAIQNHMEVALGGATVTRTVEGRERYPVRVRYQREER